MGLDEIIPDHADTSSTSSSTHNVSSQQKIVKEFGSSLGTKKFTEEMWEQIITFIRQETEYTVAEIENMRAEERHRKLHDISQAATSETSLNNAEIISDTRCIICDDDCSDSYVEIEGEKMHIHHTIGQAASELELAKQGTIHENGG